MNYLIAIGFIGTNLETTTTKSGKSMTHFLMNCKSNKEKYISYKVMFFEGSFSGIRDHLVKGTPIQVMGEFQKPSTYIDKEGNAKCTLYVIANKINFLPKKKEETISQTQFDETLF